MSIALKKKNSSRYIKFLKKKIEKKKISEVNLAEMKTNKEFLKKKCFRKLEKNSKELKKIPSIEGLSADICTYIYIYMEKFQEIDFVVKFPETAERIFRKISGISPENLKRRRIVENRSE